MRIQVASYIHWYQYPSTGSCLVKDYFSFAHYRTPSYSFTHVLPGEIGHSMTMVVIMGMPIASKIQKADAIDLGNFRHFHNG